MTIQWTNRDPRDTGMDVLVARKKRDVEIEHGPAHVPEILTDMEDAVAYLVVLGYGGSWGYGHDTEKRKVDQWGIENPVVEMRKFPSGVHHVDSETIEFARRSGAKMVTDADDRTMLLVSKEMPRVTTFHRGAPLTKAHLRVPADGAVVLVPEVEEAEDGTMVVPANATSTYPCDYCDIQPFTHPGPLARHVRLHHMDRVRTEIEAQPEPPPEPEPALTDA